VKCEQYWRARSVGRMLLSLTWLSMTAVVLGSDVRRIVATWARAPKLDGTLDDACWQAAPVTEPFLSIGTHTAAAKQTRVRVAYDRTALYLGLEADEPDMQTVRAPSRPRDADETWKDDGFEIFLTPGPGGIEYYHFIGNLAGAKYDALMGGEAQMVAWNPDPDWQVAVSRAAAGWTAEVAIPFKALDAPPPVRVNSGGSRSVAVSGAVAVTGVMTAFRRGSTARRLITTTPPAGVNFTSDQPIVCRTAHSAVPPRRTVCHRPGAGN